jgi:hypothetical protein
VKGLQRQEGRPLQGVLSLVIGTGRESGDQLTIVQPLDQGAWHAAGVRADDGGPQPHPNWPIKRVAPLSGLQQVTRL